jgi:hypothetical protein
VLWKQLFGTRLALEELFATMKRPGGPDDGADRKARAEKWTWFGHDQICLEVLSTEGIGIQIREDQTVRRIGQGGALPALSCQAWKCAVSVGAMLSRIRKTSTLLTRWARGARTGIPPRR